MNRRRFLGGAAALTAAGAGLYAAGCGGSDGDQGDATPVATGTSMMAATAVAGDVRPSLLTQEFVAGQSNRFAVGLVGSDQRLVKDAGVHVRFFTLGADGVTGTLRGEADMQFVELNVEGAHVHDSSGEELVDEDSVAFYVVNAPFDVAGGWGVELRVTPSGGGEPQQVQVPIEVREQSQSPGVGTVPPASENDTAATNPNIASLCSRDPACSLHDLVIADVLGKGRPLVVQFSTPAFCATRFCGPVLEVLLQEAPAYADRVDFVHIEVWQDFQLQQYREAVREWNLPGEPFTFFIGGDGRVVSKLEAIFSEEELRAALEGLVSA
jgi:hypothetical protein